jgi:polysaccharide biosynthesis protein PslH
MRRVYTTYVFESPAFEQRLGEILATTPIDLVHIDSLDLARYLPACRGIPVVCSHPDVESALLRQRADFERHPWRRIYVQHQARLREATERHWCERVALNVAVSGGDRVSLARIAPRSRIMIVPNGVDTEEFQPAGSTGNGVAFVGGLHWFPNLDALEFYGREILPHLRASGQQVSTRWIGSASIAEAQQYRRCFDIEVTGYVEDVRPFMRDAACHIVPLRAGGGTRVKILNSWAMGKPVVTTSIGCEGLAAVDGDNALIRDEPQEFAKAVLTVLGDRELARRLGDRGRETVERFYSWDVIGHDLVEAYRDAARVESKASAFTAIGAGHAN